MRTRDRVNRNLEMIGHSITVMQMDAVENTERLAMADSMHTTASWLMQSVVDECRECGQTWEQIGNTLGITKQAAQQRFGGTQ